MNDTEQSAVLRLISHISTGAANYVRDAFAGDKVSVIHFAASAAAEGVFCLVEGADSVYAYAVYVRHSGLELLLELIEATIRPLLTATEQREVCFNVYGRNPELVELARQMGFAADIEGYELQYAAPGGEMSSEGVMLIERSFAPDMLEPFIELFAGAYRQLNLDNGWDGEWYRRDPEGFCRTLTRHEEQRQISSYWLDGRLIGACIAEAGWIRDLVVIPEVQNRGYGSSILRRCINGLQERQPDIPVRLRVARSNEGARRLYERHHFSEVACFAEHTYPRNSITSLQ